MSQHTKGPWTRGKYGNIVDANGVDIIFRGVSTICSGSGERMAMAEANSNITAAAPELLDALQGMMQVYGGIKWDTCSVEIELQEMAKAAIAKALTPDS